MAKVNVTELKQRLCAIEEEALLELSEPMDCLTFPRWTAKSSVFPYWINRVLTFNSVEGVDDYGEELALYEYTVLSRFVIAHAQADYEGEVSEALDEVLPQIVEYGDRRELLQSTSFLDPMAYLIRAHFAQGVGFSLFPLSPGGVAQVGADFQWRCQFVQQLTQAFI